jgi:transcription initiation factor TFIIIB Brf1 subunit/transcription initiation factor TFIIB
MTTTKTKKLKNNNINKTELWNIFDSEIQNPCKQNIPLECIYGSGNRENCEHCKSILAFSEEGFLTCTNNKCGIIYKDLLDQTSEWRFYPGGDNNNSDPTRCGMPINPLLEESSYGCKVLCCGKMTYEMRKIRRYTEWQSMPYKEKSQYDEFQIITSMAQNAGISKMIIDDAIKYHKKISEYNKTFRGDNRGGIIAASIYIACIINKFPRTTTEIATIFNIDTKVATKGCKHALSIINDLEKDMDNKEKTMFFKTTPEHLIKRYCSNLNINKDITQLCEFISMNIESKNIMPGNTSQSIAAGVIYFIAQTFKLNLDKSRVRNVTNTSEVTINKCYKKLSDISKEENIIPPLMLKKYNIVL